jgi:SAM-dependent methyltransferase
MVLRRSKIFMSHSKRVIKIKNDPIELTKRYYNKHGRTGWTKRKTDSFYLEEQFTKISKLWPRGGTILDIGCAAGIHVPLFLGIGRHVKYHGFDISREFLKDARRRYPHLPFTEGDVSNISILKPKTFSGFWAGSVVMHVPIEYWNSMFSNIEARMKPGSYGYLSLPIMHPNANENEGDTRHFTLLNEGQQRKFLESRKYRVVHSGKMNGFTSTNAWRWYIVQLP